MWSETQWCLVFIQSHCYWNQSTWWKHCCFCYLVWRMVSRRWVNFECSHISHGFHWNSNNLARAFAVSRAKSAPTLDSLGATIKMKSITTLEQAKSLIYRMSHFSLYLYFDWWTFSKCSDLQSYCFLLILHRLIPSLCFSHFCAATSFLPLPVGNYFFAVFLSFWNYAVGHFFGLAFSTVPLETAIGIAIG